MSKVSEAVAAAALVGDGQTSLHSHAGGGADSEVVVVKSGDTDNSSTSLADATGLTFTPEANKTYLIEALIRFATSATTVGIGFSVNGPASPVFVAGHWVANAAQGTPDAGAFNAYNVKITSSAAPFTTDNLATLWCLFRNGGTAGPLVIRFCAETTGTVTVKDGSVLRYRLLD